MEQIWSLAPRLLISAVLAHAAGRKIGSPERVALGAQDLGVAPTASRWVGRLLAPLELAVALLLLAGVTAWAGAIVALALFVAFTALIAWNLARGQRPACTCFGEAGSEPISAWTLVRNLAFTALALLVVARGPSRTGPGILDYATSLVHGLGIETAVAAIGLVVVAQAAGILLLLAHGAGASEVAAPGGTATAHGPAGWPVGVRAPHFDLPDLDGHRVSLASLLERGRDVVLVFTDPSCRPCAALLPEVGRWQDAHGQRLTFAVLTQGSAASNRDKAEAYGLRTVLLQGGTEVASAYRYSGTPGAVVVDRDGRIASRVASGSTDIRRLVQGWAERAAVAAPESVTSPPPPPDPVLAGDPAPPFHLPSMAGDDVDLVELAGRPTLVIFWSPTCSWCHKLKPELQAWERSEDGAATQTLILTSGARALNDGQGFLSPMLLDEDGLVARAFGSTATPGAILVDADGNIASALAAGGDAVMDLARKASSLANAARVLADRFGRSAGAPAA